MNPSPRISLPAIAAAAAALLPAIALQGHAADRALVAEAAQTMRTAAEYFHEQVAVEGGYVYFYSPDLKQRFGEGVASPTQIWVQPPGTPTVGMAYLAAWRATGDATYLDAATDAGLALVHGQLESGGWTNAVDFDPAGQVAQYRNGGGKGKNNSSFDDGQSQSAIRFLVQLDAALESKNRDIREAVVIALDALLAAQFPNGGFPQVWTGPVSDQPIAKANYPDHDWRTEGRIKEYWDHYTLNDNVCGYMLATLRDAYANYREEKFLTAIKQLGDFLLLAQMPDPQPGWAQQYNTAMQPIWARKFEPAALSGDESQETIETLLEIYRLTGDKKYLEPIPTALQYLRKSLLPDGQLARYYELKSNRPLYMRRQGKVYELTYDDNSLPDHYGWKAESRLDELEAQYRRMISGDRTAKPLSSGSDLEREVRQITADLDDDGRWISTYGGERLIGQTKFPEGTPYISSERFSQHLETLSRYLKASRGG